MNLHFDVEGDEFISAGNASSKVKKALRQLGLAPDVIRKVSISMYEAEINMVIHASGGYIDVEVTDQKIVIDLVDNGPGISDVDMAMTVGYSTASSQAREMGFGAGMGLPNIKKNCNVLKISSIVDQGTTVHIEVNL
jgi:serine/threonine-protein kinase RsbT